MGTLDQAAVTALFERGNEAWPEIGLDMEVFALHLARHGTEPRHLDELEVENLFLACACANGSHRAIVAFGELFGEDIERPAKSSNRELGEDLGQVVRSKLFASDSPKIADYSGRGSLQGWVRIVAKRAHLDMVRAIDRRERRELPAQDFLDGVAEIDPELEYLKRHYAIEFRTAFQDAVRNLEVKDRTMLRHSMVFGLSIDEVGRLHGVHRATAARWLTSARQTLLASTRANMGARLGVGGDELESIMRLIDSRLNVSVIRYLRED